MNNRLIKSGDRESRILTVLVIIMLAFTSVLNAKNHPDSTRNYKNNIRFNITNPMLFGKEFNVFNYERVITDHQTASIGAGRITFPNLVSFRTLDSIGIKSQRNDRGYNFSIDYRFYLKSENKHLAPRGVYIGPYYAYNHFRRDITWEYSSGSFSETVSTKVSFAANFIGAQLGYQFVLWDRVTIDMILLGPGKWYFKLKTEFDTSLSEKDEALLLEKLNEKFQEKFPGSDFIFSGGGFEATKSSNTSAVGFRYLINLGFRF